MTFKVDQNLFFIFQKIDQNLSYSIVNFSIIYIIQNLRSKKFSLIEHRTKDERRLFFCGEVCHALTF